MDKRLENNLEKHKNLLKETLRTTIKEIFSIIEISNYLWVKWGFASNYYWLDRLSTDIDIDILNPEKEKIVVDTIREFLIKTKWKIRAERKLETWYRFVTFTEINNTKTRIQIDLNNKIFNSNKYNEVNLEWTQVIFMEKSCVNAHKLVSLSERFKDTDLYDIHYILKNNLPIDNDTIKERTWKETKDYIKELIELLDGGYYKATLTAKMQKIFCDEKNIREENKKYLDETISLLKNFINKTN